MFRLSKIGHVGQLLYAAPLGLLVVTFAACHSSSSTESSTTPAPASTPAMISVPAGTVVEVRLDRALSTERNRSGDTFDATLDAPVIVDGRTILATGTKFTGHVTRSDSSGRLEGRGILGITLDRFERDGQTYSIESSLDTRTTESHKKRNIEVIGGGTGVGALIGGIAGHGKGAAIGAAVGAAAGTGVAATTGKKDVEVPAETEFRFSLKTAIQVPD